MNILIACEESQRVCMAFREKGYKTFIETAGKTRYKNYDTNKYV